MEFTLMELTRENPVIIIEKNMIKMSKHTDTKRQKNVKNDSRINNKHNLSTKQP